MRPIDPVREGQRLPQGTWWWAWVAANLSKLPTNGGNRLNAFPNLPKGRPLLYLIESVSHVTSHQLPETGSYANHCYSQQNRRILHPTHYAIHNGLAPACSTSKEITQDDAMNNRTETVRRCKSVARICLAYLKHNTWTIKHNPSSKPKPTMPQYYF